MRKGKSTRLQISRVEPDALWLPVSRRSGLTRNPHNNNNNNNNTIIMNINITITSRNNNNIDKNDEHNNSKPNV